ncbi:MAG: AraC family transcriptional regulator [Clostridia bacterium]|nr:AraC family transcriptional regulator [Clostridia bacterium]
MSYNEVKVHGTLEFPLEFYHVDSSHPRYEMTFHWHTNLELIRVLEGELLITLNKKEIKAKKGDVVFVNSEVVHGALPNSCVYECIVYNPFFIPGVTDNGFSFSESVASGAVVVNDIFSKDDELYACVNKIFDTFSKAGDGSKYIILGLFCQMYGLIIKSGKYRSGEIDSASADSVIKLKNVLRYIRDSYDSPITLEDMAQTVGMSTKYFCSFFKSMTHKTPVEYLISYRIDRAVQKLTKTDKSITEIAFECGFNDLSYFIKTFKRINNTTPAAFRKQ